MCVNLTYPDNSHAKKAYPCQFKNLRKQGGGIVFSPIQYSTLTAENYKKKRKLITQ